MVKRAVYLGSLIDYRISFGSAEIRAQHEIHEALAEEGGIFQEGEQVSLQFLELKWFAQQTAAVAAGVPGC